MKYTKDIAKIIVFVLIIYVPLLWWNTQRAVEIMNVSRMQEYAYRIKYTAHNYKQLLQQNRIEEACIRLMADYEGLYIESFFLTGDGLVCHQPAQFDQNEVAAFGTELQAMDLNLDKQSNSLLLTKKVERKNDSGIVTDQEEVFSRYKLNDIDWIYSVKNYQPLTYFEWLKKDQLIRQSLFEQIAIVSYIIFMFIFFSVLIRIDSIKQNLSQRGQIPLWLKFFNKTFAMLQLQDLGSIDRASAKVVEENSRLQVDKELLERSLEHTLLQEIQNSNQKVPYSFRGTVAKVDINGFSQVVAIGSATTSHELAIELEKIGCEILQRYGGLFEKTIGDEIVVVFRGEDSELKAVAFMRDLMTSFSKLEFEFDGKKRSFFLKGSFASSEIIFTKRAAGYGFLGDAFTLTTRLMESITNRERNSISFLSNDFEKIDLLCKTLEPSKEVQFKNMQKYQVRQCYEFATFADVVRGPVLQNDQILFDWRKLNLFRSDTDLAEQVEWALQTSNHFVSDSIFNHMTRFEVRDATQKLVQLLSDGFKLLTTNSEVLERSRKLSRLLAATLKFIPQAQWSPDLTNVILTLPTNLEGRINSGIIELLMEKDPESLQALDLGQLIIDGDKSYRTQGQILVAQARKELTKQTLSRIIRMIESDIENESATGLFVASAVINFYWERRAAELVLDQQFSKLTRLISEKLRSGKPKLSDRLREFVQITHRKVNRFSDSKELAS